MVRNVLFCKKLQKEKSYQFKHQLKSAHPFQEADSPALGTEDHEHPSPVQFLQGSQSSGVMGIFC